MATIDDLCRAEVLVPFEIPNDVRRLPVRRLLLTQGLCDWIDGTLVYENTKMAGRTAYEHLEQFFVDFRCNERVHGSDLKRIMPTKKGTWKMHPPLLRVYGWVPHQHSFVAVCAHLEAATKKNKKLNDQSRDLVLEFIKNNDVQEIIYGDFTDAFPEAS